MISLSIWVDQECNERKNISTFCIQKKTDLKLIANICTRKLNFSIILIIIILFYLSKHAEYNLQKYHMYK